jgi:hypothetical protein
MLFEPIAGTEKLPELILGKKYQVKTHGRFELNIRVCTLVQIYKHLLIFNDDKCGYNTSVNAADLLCKDVIIEPYMKWGDFLAEIEHFKSKAV